MEYEKNQLLKDLKLIVSKKGIEKSFGFFTIKVYEFIINYECYSIIDQHIKEPFIMKGSMAGYLEPLKNIPDVVQEYILKQAVNLEV